MASSPLALVRSTREALAQTPVFRGLSHEHLDQLAALARRRVYQRGEAVFYQGDPGGTLYVIVSGQVKVVVTSESGEEVVVAILGPGDCFGELSLLDGEPRSATVRALDAVEAIALSRRDFLEVAQPTPLTMELLILLARRVRQTDELAADMAFLDLRGRLAKTLLELAKAHGRRAGAQGGVEIELQITQRDLAAMIGATRESVNKLLSWYEDRGVIQRRSGHIVVVDRERLRRRIA
jgi:CRP/FNR family transcriptional regulator, cyclic AMP receptor protein